MKQRNQTLYEQGLKNIRSGANFNHTYLIMNILATILACYGLFAKQPDRGDWCDGCSK